MSDDHNSHDVLVAKCAAMACMFCATILFGGLPFICNHYFKWTDKNSNTRSGKVVTYLLNFGGGVLLATTFIHLLPEVQEVVVHLQETGEIAKVNFALPETLMCAGFILMYLIEECIHSYLHRDKKAVLHKDAGVGAAFERGHSVRRSTLVKGGLKTKDELTDEGDEENARGSKTTLTTLDNSNGHAYPNGKSHTNNTNLSYEVQINTPAEQPKSKAQQYPLEHSLQHSHNHCHDVHHHGHSHLPINTSNEDDVLASSFRGLGIVLALSLHEVFEGLAIGLEDEAKSVWFLFGAVTAHKLVLAFCVGVELIVARTRPILAVVYSITFAIVSPIGIAIGIAVSHNSSNTDNGIPSMVLQGIACGTLLYVVFFEILSKQHAGFGAFIAMIIGFGLMFGLQNIGEGHDHHGHHHDDHDVLLNSTTTPASALRNIVTGSHH